MTKKKYFEETPNAKNDYRSERDLRVEQFECDKEFINLSKKWRENALKRKYMNNFSWMGRPLIQFPGDILAVQELISTLKPNKVIETGIAHGGSLILSSSIMFLNDIKNAEVIGIDIDIREHNKNEINKSRFSDMISLIEGSSINNSVFKEVSKKISNDDKVIVFLDSNHTHDHVMKELNLYSKLVSKGSYIVVFDTHVEDMPSDFIWEDRPWGKGNNPKTAVHEWIKDNKNFEIDNYLENKLLLTSAPDGFLYKRF